MKKWKSISDIRREYGSLSLSQESAADNPFEQFDLWFREVLSSETSDPTSMVLSTVDRDGFPDSRVVLLKGLIDEAFVFYTSYKSRKAKQITANAQVALNFYWPQTARQVRIRGIASKVSKEQSDTYFASRPVESQLSAIVSQQSDVLSSREELEKAFNELVSKNQQGPVLRPIFWGGYAVKPVEFEFWQGRDNRLHDRIQYAFAKNEWVKRRLAP